jgi:hypothetical protein
VSQQLFVRLLFLFLLGIPVTAISVAQPAPDSSNHRFIDFTAGMGIDIHAATSLDNYINLVAQPSLADKVLDFSSAIEFFAVPEIQVTENWSAAVEYAMLIKSYSINDRTGFSRSEFSYQISMPTLLVHRLLFGEGYRLKFGGGIGYHFASLAQNFPTVGSGETLTAAGVAVKLDAVGNTKFDETFYGSIGVDLRWDFPGTLRRAADARSTQSSTLALPTMNFFSAGLKFGVTFQLN